MASRNTAQRHTEPRITVTAADADRVRSVLDTATEREREVADSLALELDRATIVDQRKIAKDVVTMNSRVVFEDGSGNRREVTLVYPRQADVSNGKVSVLAPVGAALLGLSVGQEIRWAVPGSMKTFRVIDVPYQPEAAGDWNL